MKNNGIKWIPDLIDFDAVNQAFTQIKSELSEFDTTAFIRAFRLGCIWGYQKLQGNPLPLLHDRPEGMRTIPLNEIRVACADRLNSFILLHEKNPIQMNEAEWEHHIVSSGFFRGCAWITKYIETTEN